MSLFDNIRFIVIIIIISFGTPNLIQSVLSLTYFDTLNVYIYIYIYNVHQNGKYMHAYFLFLIIFYNGNPTLRMMSITRAKGVRK